MMIQQILVRYYTYELKSLHKEVCKIIRNETDLSVVEIDDTDLSLSDFRHEGISPISLEGISPVSLDRHMAEKFGIPHVMVSRIFNDVGGRIGHVIRVPPGLPDEVFVIDTDICTGSSKRLAIEHLNTAVKDVCGFQALIKVKPNQDLVDIEDLFLPISLFQFSPDTRLVHGTYLRNRAVFATRTSLPHRLHTSLLELAYKYGYDPTRDQ